MRTGIAFVVAFAIVLVFGMHTSEEALDAVTGAPTVSDGGEDINPAERDRLLHDQYGVPPMPESVADVESVVLEEPVFVPVGPLVDEVLAEIILRHHLENSVMNMSPLMWETRGGSNMEPWQMTVLFEEMSEGSGFLDGDTRIFEMIFVLPLADPASAPPPFRQEFFLPISFDPLEVNQLDFFRDYQGDLEGETTMPLLPRPDEAWRCYPCDHLRGYPGLR